MEFLCELYDSQAACGRYFVQSEFVNEVCGEDHGHARNENNGGGSVHVWVGCL